MNAVEVSELTKVYREAWGRGGFRALSCVSMTVPAGTALGLVGPNGAGKTTLVKSLLDIVRPTSGTVRVLGASPGEPRIRARIGYLPERLYLPATWRPREILASVARLRGVKAAERDTEVQLNRVGLSGATDKPVKDFSKGMKQRLGLAAALLGQPDLLVLDEPTDGIDPIGRMEIRAVLREELARGAAILLNSHLLSETERICERIAVLAAGKVLAEGPLRELCGSSRVYKIRFATAPSEEVRSALSLVSADEPGFFQLEANDAAALNAAIDALRARGAEIVELRPALRDLEDLLKELVGKGSP